MWKRHHRRALVAPAECRLFVGVLGAGCSSSPAVRRLRRPRRHHSPHRSAPSRPPVSPPTVPTFERGITPRQAPPLPAVPLVEGPLAPKARLSRGEPAHSRSRLQLHFRLRRQRPRDADNKWRTVPVAPNGTFLAFLPVPPASEPRYELFVRNGADSLALRRARARPPSRPDLALTGRLVVDSSSASPRGTSLALRDDEPVRVSVRAPENAIAWVTPAGGSTSGAAPSSRSRNAPRSPARGKHYPLAFTGGNTFATDVPARELRDGGTLYIARGGDTVHLGIAVACFRRIPSPTLGHAPAIPRRQRHRCRHRRPRGRRRGRTSGCSRPGTVVQQTGRERRQRARPLRLAARGLDRLDAIARRCPRAIRRRTASSARWRSSRRPSGSTS